MQHTLLQTESSVLAHLQALQQKHKLNSPSSSQTTRKTSRDGCREHQLEATTILRSSSKPQEGGCRGSYGPTLGSAIPSILSSSPSWHWTGTLICSGCKHPPACQHLQGQGLQGEGFILGAPPPPPTPPTSHPPPPTPNPNASLLTHGKTSHGDVPLWASKNKGGGQEVPQQKTSPGRGKWGWGLGVGGWGEGCHCGGAITVMHSR